MKLGPLIQPFNTNLHLPNFDVISQGKKTNKRGGGVLIYIHKSLTCNLLDDLCLSDNDKKILTIEITKENDTNILLLVVAIGHPIVSVKN